ncbi:hypothetical protein AB0M91_28720 [Micromonospora rifamycinica]|uniref:hypothetical protein n=1 Tax=Micromonospora rifamycinica TaxID=291594 RepID=UPI0033C20067
MTKRLTTKQTIGITLAGLLGVCCCGSSVTRALNDDDKPKPLSIPAASASISVKVPKLVDPLPSLDPIVTSSPTASAAKPTRTPATRKTTSPPRTTAPKPKPKPTPVKTTAPSAQKGVHPGALCSPRGALGRTSTGKLMRCGPSATDSRNRWRAA